MTLTLRYRGQTSIPVEIEGFTPDWVCTRSLPEIERFEIFHGNQKIPLAEMFSISGDPNDERIQFEGDLGGVHWIGAGMTVGEIHIAGSAGRHLGSGLRGGEILVEGNSSDWTGAEMRAGTIHVRGNVGNHAGGAYRGSTKGMTGGTILIDGNAGNEVANCMRRGLIAIGGDVGDMLAFSMIAGTVLAFGACGVRPGAGMRRGTLGLFGRESPRLMPSFRYATVCRPQFLGLVMRQIKSKGLHVEDSLLTSEFDLFHGDFVSSGRGEVFARRQN
jgi:formylmethanofuran dehydrogenase subunit C